MAPPDKPGGKQQPKREHDVHVRGTIHTDLSPNEEKRHNTERKEDATAHAADREIDAGRERIKMWLEGLTLAAVLLYAGISYWQGTLTRWQAVLTRESIDNNSKQFQIDQRPYVWTTEISQSVHIKAGEQLWTNFYFANFGKSPALKEVNLAVAFFGPKAREEAEGWFQLIHSKEWDQALKDNPHDFESVIPPGTPTYRPEVMKQVKNNPGGEAGGFGGIAITVRSLAPINAADAEYIRDHNFAAVFAITSQYFDGFGNRYWNDICVMSGKNTATQEIEAIAHCAHHNEMH